MRGTSRMAIGILLCAAVLMPAVSRAQNVVVTLKVQDGKVTGIMIMPDPVLVGGSSANGVADGQRLTFTIKADAPIRLAGAGNKITFPGGKPFGQETISFGGDLPLTVVTAPAQVVEGTFQYTVTIDPQNTKLKSLGGDVSGQGTIEIVDTIPPTCRLTASGTSNGKSFIEITVQDVSSGLARIDVLQSDNADVTGTAVTVGSTDPHVVTATKITQGLSAHVELGVFDVAGNETVCDPVLTQVVRSAGKPVEETFTGLFEDEGFVRITNGSPGLQHLELVVNGVRFKVSGLRDGEERGLDISRALHQGNTNTVVLRATGKPGGSATVLIWDGR